MTWTVSPHLMWGKHHGGWFVELDADTGLGPKERFEAPSEFDAMVLANILNTAGAAGWGDARDAALEIVYAREAAE